MAFDWPAFLDRHSIDYLEKGKDQIAIHCPMCGSADAGRHMSINLTGRGWRCWRQPQSHYGRSPVRLIATLINCSYEHAAQLAGHKPIPDFSSSTDLLSQVRRLDEAVATVPLPHLPMPADFKRLNIPANRLPIKYLLKRGFSKQHVEVLAKPPFDLRYCSHEGRIIFPIYYHHQLVAWTGRTVYRNDLRYKTFGPIGNCLLWFDHLRETNASTIVLTEGPFDAAKVTMLGLRHGIVATCFFTALPSAIQTSLLHGVLPKFRRRILLLDQDTSTNAQRLLWRDLAYVGLEIKSLPTNTKDPGDIHNDVQLLKVLC